LIEHKYGRSQGNLLRVRSRGSFRLLVTLVIKLPSVLIYYLYKYYMDDITQVEDLDLFFSPDAPDWV